ncbi:unnamed protein product, partial [Ceratitis capitata]
MHTLIALASASPSSVVQSLRSVLAQEKRLSWRRTKWTIIDRKLLGLAAVGLDVG